MASASQHVRKYVYPGEQGSSPGTSDDESPKGSARRFTSLDGFRDSMSKHRELRKVISSLADTRLEPGQIRLIYFKHSKRSRKWSSKSTITFSRYNFKLDNAPPFRALSYTYGPPYRERRTRDGIDTLDEPVGLLADRETQVRCDGRLTPINTNLYDALHQLRYNLRRDVWLWVDALCIQQEDQEERASQVMQMDKIYTSAQEVLVWLGHPLGLRYDVLSFMREFCDVATRLLDPSTGSVQAQYKGTEILNTSWHPILEIADFEDKLMDLMIFLKLCRYFSRLWVVQEVALATKPTIMWYNRMENFYCVTYLVDYFQAAGWFHWLDEKLDEKDYYLPGEPWIALVGLTSLILRFDSSTFETSFFRLRSRADISISKTTRSFFDFAELLHYSRSLTCSDARDKIYSLLGLASWRIDRQLMDIAAVDYTIAVEELYTKVHQTIMSETQCIDLLSFVGRSLSESDPTLPSWVPDHRHSDHLQSAVEVYLQPRAPSPDPLLEVDAGQQYISVDDAALCCWGAYFDEVEHNFRQPHGGCDRMYEHWVPSHQATFDALISTIGSSTGPSPFTTLLNTLLIGTLESQPDGTADLTDEIDYYFAVYLILNHVYKGAPGDRSVASTLTRCSQLSTNLQHWGIPKPLLSRLETLVSEVHQAVASCNDPAEITNKFEILQAKYDTPISRFVAWSKRVANNRVLVRTKRGLLASTQKPVETGDQIVVLAGSRTAYVLRKAAGEDEYVFGGDCFIWHGQREGLPEEMAALQKQIRPIRII